MPQSDYFFSKKTKTNVWGARSDLDDFVIVSTNKKGITIKVKVDYLPNKILGAQFVISELCHKDKYKNFDIYFFNSYIVKKGLNFNLNALILKSEILYFPI